MVGSGGSPGQLDYIRGCSYYNTHLPTYIANPCRRKSYSYCIIPTTAAAFSDPIPLHNDNQSAISLTRDHQYHARTKHIDIRYHFIRWVVEDKKIKLIYCPTEDMVADVLTKALPSPKVKHFASALGLLSA